MILIHDEDDFFTADIPEPERFDGRAEGTGRLVFQAEQYSWNARADRWQVSGTVRNKDGSLHRGGRREFGYLNHDEVPVTVRMQAQAYYDDLADRLAAKYRKVALEALSEENITYDDDDDDDVEPLSV